MGTSIVQLYPGPYAIDVQELNGVIVDVIPNATRGLRRQKPGLDGSLAELEQNIAVHAKMLGIAPDLFARIAEHGEKLAKVRAARVIVDKLAEVLEETEVYIEDEREGDIGIVVKAARDASRRKDPSIVASFQRTIEYHGQIASRAQATRRKAAGKVVEGPLATEEQPAAPPSPTDTVSSPE